MLTIDHLIQQLHAIYPISNELKDRLQQVSELSSLKQKTIFIKEGQKLDQLIIPLEGLIRTFTLNEDGTTTTINFISKGEFLFDINSFYNNSRSDRFYETLTDVSFASISFTQLRTLLNQFIELNFIARVLAHKYILDTEQRLQLLHKAKAVDRWIFFKETYPHLAAIAPLGHIASFLGIKQETLSRVRGKR